MLPQTKSSYGALSQIHLFPIGEQFMRENIANVCCRPEVGPLVGGYINQYANWRWSFYVLLIWSGIQLALIILFVPETYHPVLLRKKAQRLRKETGNDSWKAPIEKTSRSIAKTVLWSCIRPFQLLVLEPMVRALRYPKRHVHTVLTDCICSA